MYIVIELQKSNGDVASIVIKKDSYNEAMSQFHMILASAAISSVEAHSAAVLSDEGQFIKNECFYHPVEPTPEPEPTPDPDPEPEGEN